MLNKAVDSMRRPSIRQSAFLLLLIFYVYVGFCVWSIMADQPNMLNAFYQPQKPALLPIAVAYPPIFNGQMQDEWLEVRINLKADSTLSEGVNLTLADMLGTIFINDFSLYGQEVDNVWLGFQYAQPWSSFTSANTVSGQIQNHEFTALDGDWLVALHNATYWQSVNGNPYALGYCPLVILEQMVFNFPSAGDYSPSMIVGLSNGTFLSCTYDQIKVHVVSNSELQTIKVGRIDTAIAVSLLLFAGIEGVSVVNDLTKKRLVNEDHE
jgi:hypothetical protein